MRIFGVVGVIMKAEVLKREMGRKAEFLLHFVQLGEEAQVEQEEQGGKG